MSLFLYDLFFSVLLANLLSIPLYLFAAYSEKKHALSASPSTNIWAIFHLFLLGVLFVRLKSTPFFSCSLPALPFSLYEPDMDLMTMAASIERRNKLDFTRNLQYAYAAGMIIFFAAYFMPLFHGLRKNKPGKYGVADKRILSIADASARSIGLKCRIRVDIKPGSFSPYVSLYNPRMIVLPEAILGKSDSLIFSVLVHEMMHIKSGDTYLFPAIEILRALLWYNPLIHASIERWKYSREMICDREATREAGNALDYAEYLLELGKKKKQLYSAAIGISGNNLENRINSILHRSGKRHYPVLVCFAASAVLLLIFSAQVVLPQSLSGIVSILDSFSETSPIEKKIFRRGWRFQPDLGLSDNIASPVRAADDGRVSLSRYDSYMGNVIKIIHGNNTETIYARLTNMAVSTGQRVKKGQIIGYVLSGNPCSNPGQYEVWVDRTGQTPPSYPCENQKTGIVFVPQLSENRNSLSLFGIKVIV